jgi:hypothetical protein
MKDLTDSVKEFIAKSKPTGGADDEVGLGRAKEWLDGTYAGEKLPQKKLEEKMKLVADFATDDNDRVIYHEPHHELTPGMILTDELFRALVKEVTVMVQAISPINPKKPAQDLKELLAYVEGLQECEGDSAKFGAYLLPSGDIPCPLRPEESIHVDPSRIELFLEGGQIRVTSIIVGAWKGGTHSAGHTT